MKKPLNDYVIVKQTQAPKTEGSFIIPSNSQSKPKSGIIVSVSDEVKCKELKEGVLCLYDEAGIKEIEVDGINHLIMKEGNIYCIDL